MVVDLLAEIIVRSAGGFFRFRNLVKHKKQGLIKKIYLNLYLSYLDKHGSYIGLETVFKNEPHFPHGLSGVFISGGAIVGKNCVIFQNVKIGSNIVPGSKNFGFPTIGDNCFIGAGATIIGNVNIGDNCRIGANATIFENLPSNSVAVTTKPRIIQRDQMDNNFYTNIDNKWVVYKNGKYEVISDKSTIDKFNQLLRERNIIAKTN